MKDSTLPNPSNTKNSLPFTVSVAAVINKNQGFAKLPVVFSSSVVMELTRDNSLYFKTNLTLAFV